MNRFNREQVVLDRKLVLRRHACIRSVGKRWIKILSVAADAAVQRTDEFGIAPQTDPSFFVRRDVGRIDSAERQRERKSSGKGLAAPERMASCAICRPDQIFAALYRVRTEVRTCIRYIRKRGGPEE